MAKNGPKSPDLSIVPDPQLDPMTKSFLGAVRRESEYETGIRSVNQDWINKLLTDPEHGEMLEDMLHDTVSVGRREPDQQAEVKAECQAIISSLTDSTIVLTDKLVYFKDRFLRALDLMNPALYEEVEDEKD